jgi:hypothetical protein
MTSRPSLSLLFLPVYCHHSSLQTLCAMLNFLKFIITLKNIYSISMQMCLIFSTPPKKSHIHRTASDTLKNVFDHLVSDNFYFKVNHYCYSCKFWMIYSASADELYRSDFFPGLGWMLTRSTWNELSPKWPKAYP